MKLSKREQELLFSNLCCLVESIENSPELNIKDDTVQDQLLLYYKSAKTLIKLIDSKQ